jgi:hypothetical protein
VAIDASLCWTPVAGVPAKLTAIREGGSACLSLSAALKERGGAVMWEQLLVGAVGSLMATVAYIGVTYLATHKFKAQIIRLALRMLGVGLDRVYKDQSDAQEDISAAARGASMVRVLGMRGRSLVDGYLNFLLDKPFRKVCLLLADPDAPLDYNPVAIRAREIILSDDQTALQRYTDEARETLRALYRWNDNPGCMLKVYQFPPIFRMVATERTMFFSFYPEVGRARDNVMFRVPSDSPLYIMLSRYFDKVWTDTRTRHPEKYRNSAAPT